MIDLELVNSTVQKMVEEGILPEAWTLVALHEVDSFTDMEIISSLGPQETLQILAGSTMEFSKELNQQQKNKDMH